MKRILGLLFALSIFFTVSCSNVNPRINLADLQKSVFKVDIRVPNPTKEDPKATLSIGSGSAFAVGKHEVLTADHVCRAINTLSKVMEIQTDLIVVKGNSEYLVVSNPTIVKQSKQEDLCLFYIRSVNLSPLRMASVAPRLGDEAFVYGAPIGIPGILTEGLYIGRREVEIGDLKLNLSMYAAPSYFGNSGGPILDRHGRVIGVLVAGVQEYPYISFGSRFEAIKKFLE